ncbi:hypothetical protein ABT061_25185 [Streptosporangium sp. NPDC002544]|uniref:hypothetical protein n=1 Tax=Streptosporangium sp. NPDC002544 TaxID=3154538 RepID=UPI00331DAF80
MQARKITRSAAVLALTAALILLVGPLGAAGLAQAASIAKNTNFILVSQDGITSPSAGQPTATPTLTSSCAPLPTPVPGGPTCGPQPTATPTLISSCAPLPTPVPGGPTCGPQPTATPTLISSCAPLPTPVPGGPTCGPQPTATPTPTARPKVTFDPRPTFDPQSLTASRARA